jgi:F-type H+-transporting ATPase subunit b
MPQLDAVTFLSQVFWLTLFFVTYYRVGLNFILPSLAGRLKTRGKKAVLAKGRVSGFDGERLSALAGYDSAMGASSAWVSGLTAKIAGQGEAWRQEQGRAADAGALAASNKAYLAALSGSRAERALAVKA